MEGEVEQTLRKLTQAEERVLRMRFGIGERACNLDEIGKRCGLSRGWVRQIEARALRNLRADAVRDWEDLH
jgi:RNA polymerase primary sigma factor